jgi:hypothetical protein
MLLSHFAAFAICGGESGKVDVEQAADGVVAVDLLLGENR